MMKSSVERFAAGLGLSAVLFIGACKQKTVLGSNPQTTHAHNFGHEIIQTSPLEYTKSVAELPENSGKVATAKKIVEMAERSENLDRTLMERSNNSPKAIRSLAVALKDYEKSTGAAHQIKNHCERNAEEELHYTLNPLSNKDAAILNACNERGRISEETGNIVMACATSFQRDGILNDWQFDRDLNAMRLLAARADKATLVTHGH